MLAERPDAFDKAVYVVRPILPPLDKIMRRLTTVWDCGILTNFGEQHAELKKRLADILNVEHISLCNNGTSALLLAMRILGIRGKVATTPFTFPATVNALDYLGIEPIFCDIDPQSLNLDVEKLDEVCATNNVSAILGVHVYGNPCDITAIANIADRNNMRVIYDAAHAFGVEINGKGIGQFGDISAFSFHATKLFHTAEGGALTYSNRDYEREIYLQKNFGIKSEDEVVRPGINAKLNEIQAAIGIEVCELLDAEICKREVLYREYIKRLSGVDGLTLPFHPPDNIKQNYQYFYILIEETRFGCSRDILYSRMKEFNIYTRKYFYPLCSSYSWYRELESSQESNLPVANRISERVLVLPLHGGLEAEDINQICDILLYIKKYSG